MKKLNTDTKLEPYGKESNPEALYLKESEKLPYTSGNLKTAKIDLFAPRGDHAKDAFDKELFDSLEDNFDN